ncbi:AMP-binding protein [Catenulispora pinistramenti]|uniref:AMP-binding protein n=1 Tax=Catenulispora pinistramenti TaxID=2705254 RepID=UPI0027DC0AEA|nr:AMP-binding protein [Catenulispora pinistramenti]
MSDNGRTLHGELDRTARSQPGQLVSFVNERVELRLDELCAQSRSMALVMAESGVRRGDRVGLMLANEPAFLISLVALSRLGACACPLSLPTSGRDGYAEKVQGILAAAGVRQVVVSRKLARLKSLLAQALAGVSQLPADELAHGEAGEFPEVSGDDDLIVQFTSGSTSRPKGVRLRQTNLLAGLDAIRLGVDLGRPGDRAGVWLPLFHDMGLVGMLAAVVTGIPVSIWSPSSFVKDPARWLREVSDGGHTACAMPNFAYDLLRQAVPADDVPGYDLSRWRVAFNGAEPIAADSVAAFLAHFEPAGFRPEAMLPVYGLAEATLAVAFPPLGREPKVDWVDRVTLAESALAVPRDSASSGARPVVALGGPVAGIEFRIADPKNDGVLGERRVGEVQVQGAPVTPGYVGTQEQPLTVDGWLRTGDLGYLADGELHVTGRIKEMMIVRGVNYYPEDIEALIRADAEVYRRRCVAFIEGSEAAERIVLVAETTVDDDDERSRLRERLRAKVIAETGLEQLAVTLVGPNSIPRTSSGKLKRLESNRLVV